MNKSYQARKKKVGGEVFGNFSKKVTNDHFKKGEHTQKIILAGDLAEEMPFVTMPLVENGFIKKGESFTHLLNIYQPNLWAQDFAHSAGELGKMTVSTAIERANASVEYILRNLKKVHEVMKKKGLKEYDLYLAMRQAALIESGYYTRLGEGEMPESTRKKIDSALLRRTYRNMPLFKSVIDAVGVNGIDGKELLDFSSDIELTDVLQEFVENDPYYNRRSRIIKQFGEMNAETSASLKQINTVSFFDEMITRAIKRFPSVRNSLRKALEEVDGKGA